MEPSVRFSLPWRFPIALSAGTLLGALLGASYASNPFAQVIGEGCELASFVTLAWLRALAIPVVVYSLILGGAGLETMRRTGQLLGRMVVWIVGTTLLAVLTAFAVAWWAGPNAGVADFYYRRGLPHYQPDPFDWTWGWIALVSVSIGLGYYRNQLEDGHGRLILRFCQALEGMVSPLVRWAQRLSPIGVFFLVTTVTARYTPYVQAFSGKNFTPTMAWYERGGLVLLATALAYLFFLTLAVVLLARVNPWRCFRSLVPAMTVAAAGQSVEGALPLTTKALRDRSGVSQRVAGLTLSMAAAVHRDGVALLWTAAVLFLSKPGSMADRWLGVAATALAALILGCGGNAVTTRNGLISLLLLQTNGWSNDAVLPTVIAWLILFVGNAISVFSHACATLVIARGEGEYWVPGQPPNPDELQELKNDLALADS